MNKELKYDWSDFCLIPETLTDIVSRQEIELNHLPLMVSPMDSVIDRKNESLFIDNGFTVCMPRLLPKTNRNSFESMSLDGFESFIHEFTNDNWQIRPDKKILVDVANGHMERLYNLTRKLIEHKNVLTRPQLMIGNIANPQTYKQFAALGVDYIRCGIGGGSACTTSANIGVHYPMASLITECYKIKKTNGFNTKIVADGGFKNFDEIIKALASGADYVMLGSILNKCLESCADTYFCNIKIKSDWVKKLLWDNKITRKYLTKSYRGMSTKAVQKKWNRSVIKTAEGISKTNNVEYTISQWRENFEDYLRSAMSYCGARTLQEFKESQKVFITNSAFKRFHK